MTGLFRLGECKDSITTHLNTCHLSRESMTEFELILTRAGVFELPPPKVNEMMICPKHRHSIPWENTGSSVGHASILCIMVGEKPSRAWTW